MQIGITGKQTITVTEEKTAQAMGSGTLPVFATPAMIALMENTASKSVEAKLDEADLAAAEDTRRFSSDEVFSRVRERIDGHRKV